MLLKSEGPYLKMMAPNDITQKVFVVETIQKLFWKQKGMRYKSRRCEETPQMPLTMFFWGVWKHFLL